MGRVHLSLDKKELEWLMKLAKSTGDSRITGAVLIVAAVFCLIDRYEKDTAKKKAFTMNKVRVDPKAEEDPFNMTRLHVYFGRLGKQEKLIQRLARVSKKSGMPVSRLVRKAVQVCEPVFKRHVLKGKPFKCCGKQVTF